jgi:hypothetical protein
VCATCFGVGQPFGDLPTPSVVIVRLFDLLPGDLWEPEHAQLLLTPHYLPQFGSACGYFVDDGIFTWQLLWNPTETLLLVMRNVPGIAAFERLTPSICSLYFVNDIQHAAGTYAYNGSAIVCWL